ncbi:Cell division cycle protein, partial [mine drainage metagenome]
MMSKWYGESEGKIAELLKTARERAPCILFMDEIDAIAKRRDMYAADDVTPRLLSILLSEMDGIDKSAGVIVVGSTNKPDLIDQAM